MTNAFAHVGVKLFDRKLWFAYGLIWSIVWLLHVVSALQGDVERGLWRPWAAAYQASWTLGPALVVGIFIVPLTIWVHEKARLSHHWHFLKILAVHVIGALAFGLLWQCLSYVVGYWLYAEDYANATLTQTALWRMIWALFMYAGLVLGFTALISAREARRNAISAAQADSARSKAELSALRGKLNPHFLFNTLNTLIALTRKDAQRAEQNLIRFSGLLRHVLDNQRSGQDFCSVDQEVSFVSDYLELEKLRLGQRLSVNWDIDPQTSEARIPALGLQPLIENAIVHGIAPKIKGGTIQISIQRVQKNAQPYLAMVIRDDGMGCDLANLNQSKRTGIGLSAVKQRFELAYGNQLIFDMQSAVNQGMRINIQIPFDLE